MPSSSIFLQIEAGAHGGAFGNNPTPTPTGAQCKAGNYKLGRVTLHGMDIAIEQPRGTYRTGIGPDGKRWTSRMAAHYGYFAQTKGNDGDEVDCFIGFYPQSELAFVINQNVAGRFDEHKIMLCFPDEESARRAYTDSYERGWPGLASIVPASISQLKWWLKNGNMTRPLKPEHLPHEGLEAMTRRTQWNADALPYDQTLDQVLYDIRRSDAGENLMLDSVSMADILEDSEGAYILDAMVVPMAGLERKMSALQRVMERAALTVKPVAKQISDPFTQRGVANITALFELSDGQTVAIYFHNPDVTPKKITGTDELISWKWLLNKKDITIVVAPEHGEDLNVNEVAKRIMKLAEKNSAAFVRANGKRAERMQNLANLTTEIAGLEVELKAAQNDLEAAKIEAEDRAAVPAAAQPTQAPETQPTAKYATGQRVTFKPYPFASGEKGAQVADGEITRVQSFEESTTSAMTGAKSGKILFSYTIRLDSGLVREQIDEEYVMGLTGGGAPTAKPNPIVAADATYEFTDATDAFKQAATSGGSDFATAEKMDAKAKELGLKVSWSTGKALLDSATGEPDDDEDDDGEDDDFDAEDEWDATPELDSCGGESKKPLLDGDFKGHPFRGNKYRKAGHSSSAAVGSSIRAKTAERKGSAKEVKAAHKEAHYAHMAASIGATGKTKRYHRKMANLHGQRGGVKGMLDSAADGLAVENALALAAGFFGGTVVLDSAATVSHAVAQLQVALSVVENNEPINRASGYVTQADLERDSAQDFRSAISILKGCDRGATLDSVTGDCSDEDGDSMEDDEDFDAKQEWDAVPELDSCGDEVPKPILDGDFKGHPFRGNQFKKVGHSSRAAVGSTLQAKTIERKGGTKKALKAAHKEAYYSHRAAAVSASGKTKRYHKKMAKFHAGRSGVEIMDSAAILDATAGPQGLIGKVKKGVKIIGRISIGDDGKAMIFTGNAGKERVKTDEGKPAIWADDEAAGLLDYLVADLPSPTAKGGAMPIAKRNKLIDDFQNRQDSLSEGYKAIRELFKTMSVAKSAGKDVGIMAAADFAKAGDLLKSGQVTQVQYDEFAALYSETSGVPVSAVAPAPTPATPSGETPKKLFYVTMIRGDQVARLAGPFSTGEQAQLMIPRAQEEAHKVDPRSAFDPFGVTEISENNPKAGVLNSQLGLPLTGVSGEPVSAKKSPQRIPQSLLDMGFTMIPNPLGGQQSQATWTSAESAPYVRITVKHTPNPDAYRVTKGGRYVTLISGENALPTQDVGIFGSEESLLVAVRAIMASARPAAPAPTKKGEAPVSEFQGSQAFKDWYNDADMPEKDADGEWVDLETGLPFSGGVASNKSDRSQPAHQETMRKRAQRKIEKFNEEKAKEFRAAPVSEISKNVARLSANQQWAAKKFADNPNASEYLDLATTVSEIAEKISAAIEKAGDAGPRTKAAKEIKDMYLEFSEANVAASRAQNKIPAAPSLDPIPTEDPQMTSDRTLFQSVIDGTVTTSDGEGILSASLADTLEAAYLRHAGNAEMDDLFEKAINAYTEAELVASANL